MLLGSAGESGYNLTRSLRFRASASAYLNRTPAVSGNVNRWTWSGWVKLGNLDVTTKFLFSCGSNTSFYGGFAFASNRLDFGEIFGGSFAFGCTTNNLFRDPSAWYHIVLLFDSTQATATNRLKIFVNGSEVTYSSYTAPALNQNSQTNLAQPTLIGANFNGPVQFFDGYLAEVNFIDGQGLPASSFGSTNALTGVWQPAAYTGSYGTNGFYLPFTDNSALTTSSNVGLGKDFSGNGNYWTTNNISITAGVTYDSMTDVPTLTSATAANYAVLNPLDATGNATLSNANLQGVTVGVNGKKATIAVSSGKWYWEGTCVAGNFSGVGLRFGIDNVATPVGSGVRPGNTATSYTYNSWNGNKSNNSISAAYGSTYTTSDIISVALDLDNGKIWWAKNGVWQASGDPTAGTNEAYSGVSGSYTAIFGDDTGGGITVAFNFGQRPFTYTPPTGFVALNAFNLPASTIVDGSDNFNIALDTGANIKTASEALYPSNYFEWIKDRANANNHQLIDIVRGSTAVLQSNTTAAETTYTAPSGNSVGWVWKANGAAVSNTDGSITSQVSANASAGFSVVTYNGSATAGATVGHGLGVAPAFVIATARGAVTSRSVYHSALGASQYILLNTTAAAVSSTQEWGGVAPTSSVITIGNASANNNQATSNVLYAFAQIAGYSAFGKYQGNSSADGVFVYTGFRPKFIVLRPYDGTADWILEDTSRSSFNVSSATLYPNSSGAEASGTNLIDFLSNGFKLRTASGNVNSSSNNYLYACFAENPFKFSLAR
jgi:hypothetical protein